MYEDSVPNFGQESAFKQTWENNYLEEINLKSLARVQHLTGQVMDNVQKPSDSECYIPSSEPFRFY
jgi:hypothetical protein